MVYDDIEYGYVVFRGDTVIEEIEDGPKFSGLYNYKGDPLYKRPNPKKIGFELGTHRSVYRAESQEH